MDTLTPVRGRQLVLLSASVVGALILFRGLTKGKFPVKEIFGWALTYFFLSIWTDLRPKEGGPFALAIMAFAIVVWGAEVAAALLKAGDSIGKALAAEKLKKGTAPPGRRERGTPKKKSGLRSPIRPAPAPPRRVGGALSSTGAGGSLFSPTFGVSGDVSAPPSGAHIPGFHPVHVGPFTIQVPGDAPAGPAPEPAPEPVPLEPVFF